MSGERVSTAKCFFKKGRESGQFWRERVGRAPSVAGMLSSEIATVVLIFVLPVEEATWLLEFKHLIYSLGLSTWKEDYRIC